MSTAVTPNLETNPERQYGQRMAIADGFLRSRISDELRRRPDNQSAIHLSWTELTKLLSDYAEWAK